MKKANTLLVVVALFLCHLSTAQVKRQYQDEKFAETTVVIKDDKATDDLEVLNTYFDMDEIAVGQIIRITTENINPQPAIEEKEEVVSPLPPNRAVKAPAVVKTEKVANATPKTVEKTALGAATPTNRKVQRIAGNAPKEKSYIYSTKNNRVKKQQRKKGKKNKKKCYGF